MFQADRLWAAASACFVIAAAGLAHLRIIDRRVLSGENVWSKPLKFALAFPMHLATLAVASHFLPSELKDQAWLRNSALISIGAAFFEFGYIAFQAARRRRSHFNTETSFERVMYGLMGLGSVLVVAPSVLIGITAAFVPRIAWEPCVRWAVAVSFVAGAALTLLTGFQMGSLKSHFAVDCRRGRKMPLTGWSLTGDDVRPFHFLAVHMMQVIPVVAIVASLVVPRPAANAVVAITSVGWTWLTLQTLHIQTRVGRRQRTASRGSVNSRVS